MFQGRFETRESKGQGNIHGVTAADKRRCDEQITKKNHTGITSVTKKPQETQTGGGGRNNTVQHSSQVFKSHSSPLSPIFCFCLIQDTDHSYIIFLILYLLNNDPALNYVICGQNHGLNRIHSTVSLTNALLFDCLHGLCCTRYTSCKGHNQNLSKV